MAGHLFDFLWSMLIRSVVTCLMWGGSRGIPFRVGGCYCIGLSWIVWVHRILVPLCCRFWYSWQFGHGCVVLVLYFCKQVLHVVVVVCVL